MDFVCTPKRLRAYILMDSNFLSSDDLTSPVLLSLNISSCILSLTIFFDQIIASLLKMYVGKRKKKLWLLSVNSYPDEKFMSCQKFCDAKKRNNRIVLSFIQSWNIEGFALFSSLFPWNLWEWCSPSDLCDTE